MSILNGLDVRKIINSNPFEQNIIALTSNLEAILQNVSKDALEDFGCKNINELTLRQLGRIYTSVLYKNDGIYGICREYGIYKFLLYGDDYVHSIFNDAINKLTCETGDESIDVILWGGERNSLDVEAILSSLDDGEKLWCEGKLYNFKEIIKTIYLSFRREYERKKLHKSLKYVWKTDMFVKKRGSDTWFAVTVKWNKAECKHYAGLSIGIHFENVGTYGKAHKVKVQKNTYGQNQFAVFCVPFMEFNFSKYIVDKLNFLKKVLNCINSKNKNINIAYFGNPNDYELFLLLYKLREYPCVLIIDDLKTKFQINSVTEKKDSVIVSTDNKIIESLNELQYMQNTFFDVDLIEQPVNNVVIVPDIIV